MDARELPGWLPVVPPTWGDALAGGALSLWSWSFAPGRMAWPWFAAGVGVALLAYGPFAGSRADEWFHDIGPVGRAVAILLFAFALWRVEATVGLPRAPTNGIAAGVVAGVLVSVVLPLLYYREAGPVGGRSS